jgi:hypothetical protein
MNIKPTHLFLLLTTVSLIFGYMSTCWPDRPSHIFFSYNHIDFRHFFVPIWILSGLTTLCYYLTEKMGRQISNKIGYWHFGLIVLGLFSSYIVYDTVLPLICFDHQNFDELYIADFDIYFYATVTAGLLLLLSGLSVFIVGLFRALSNK